MLLAITAISLGSLASSAIAQQGQTFRPPVHIPPNQQYNANYRYSGIAAPETQEPQYSIVGSIPEPTMQQNAQPTMRRRGPQLQDRLAQAFSPRKKRQVPQQQPQAAVETGRAPTPVQSGSFAQGEDVRQAQSMATEQYNSDRREVVPPQYRQQVQQIQSRGNVAVETGRPAPVEQVVERRPVPRRYPVQQINNNRLLDPPVERQPAQQQFEPSQVRQTDRNVQHAMAAQDEYYTRQDIQATAAQEYEDDILYIEEPVVEAYSQQQVNVAELPVYDEPTRANPISVLRSTDNGYHQDEEDSPESFSSPRLNQGNGLRDSQDEMEDVMGEEYDDSSDDDEDLETTRRSLEKSCDQVRSELLNNPITQIALDISPPKSAIGNQYGSQYRQWNDVFGRGTGSGTASRVQRGYVILDSGQKLPVGNFSDGDLAAYSDFWQLPKECTVSLDTFYGRSWVPQTLTWKASNLCHKPLYFENVQLERYGHSRGPLYQPVHSTVHFFTSLALLPYNTGINPPNECRYALGYYRPGNCAPWLKDPFPISLAGAENQAKAMVGAAFLIAQ